MTLATAASPMANWPKVVKPVTEVIVPLGVPESVSVLHAPPLYSCAMKLAGVAPLSTSLPVP